jgi:hypothetical protein
MPELVEGLLEVARLILEEAQGGPRPVTQLRLKTEQAPHGLHPSNSPLYPCPPPAQALEGPLELFKEEWHEMALAAPFMVASPMRLPLSVS